MSSRIDVEYKSGLTWRSFLALIFAIIVIQPAVIYYYLVSGISGLPLSVWMIILLWNELAALLGAKLTRQEIFIIMAFEWIGLWGGAWYFLDLIKKLYYANSEIAIMFDISGQVPFFFSPIGSDAIRILHNRTFLDPAWTLPIIILILSVVFSVIANISLGIFSYNLYGVVARLEFPWASAQAKIIETIAEERVEELRIFFLSMLAGILYNFLAVFLPFILGVEIPTKQPIDLTYLMDLNAPGGLLVVPSDFDLYVIGFILPLDVCFIQLIGMIATYIVGNNIITSRNMWPAEATWKPGYGWMWIYSKSQLYFWLSLAIGLGVSVALVPMVVHYRDVIKTFSIISRLKERGEARGEVYLAMFLISAIGTVTLVYILVPSFPVWILLLLVIGWSFIATLLQTYAAGVTLALNIPYLKELLIYFSGYKGLDAWYAPIQVYTGGSGVAQHLKMAEIVKCRMSDYIKAYILVTFLGLLMSFVYVSIFWYVAPIPSYAYPYTITGWPVEALDFWRFQKWLWTGYMFRIDWITSGIISGGVLYLICDFILKKPFIPIALISGILQLPTYVIAQFVGSFIGSKLIARKLGRDKWSKTAPYLVMGFLLGDNILGTLVMVLKLVGKAAWLLPY